MASCHQGRRALPAAPGYSKLVRPPTVLDAGNLLAAIIAFLNLHRLSHTLPPLPLFCTSLRPGSFIAPLHFPHLFPFPFPSPLLSYLPPFLFSLLAVLPYRPSAPTTLQRKEVPPARITSDPPELANPHVSRRSNWATSQIMEPHLPVAARNRGSKRQRGTTRGSLSRRSSMAINFGEKPAVARA